MMYRIVAVSAMLWSASGAAQETEPDPEVKQALAEELAADSAKADASGDGAEESAQKKLKDQVTEQVNSVFRVPEVPAASFLNIAADKVQRPGNLSEAAAQVSTLIGSDGEIKPGAAAEVAPCRLIMGNDDLAELYDGGWGKQVCAGWRVSFASAEGDPDANGEKPVLMAFGTRLVLYDSRDLSDSTTEAMNLVWKPSATAVLSNDETLVKARETFLKATMKSNFKGNVDEYCANGNNESDPVCVEYPRYSAAVETALKPLVKQTQEQRECLREELIRVERSGGSAKDELRKVVRKCVPNELTNGVAERLMQRFQSGHSVEAGGVVGFSSNSAGKDVVLTGGEAWLLYARRWSDKHELSLGLRAGFQETAPGMDTSDLVQEYTFGVRYDVESKYAAWSVSAYAGVGGLGATDAAGADLDPTVPIGLTTSLAVRATWSGNDVMLRPGLTFLTIANNDQDDLAMLVTIGFGYNSFESDPIEIYSKQP